MNIAVKTIGRFFLSTFFFFLLLNIFAVPILISQAPQEGTWYFSSRLITLWNTFFITSIILSFLRVHLFLYRNPKPLIGQIVLLFTGIVLVYPLLLALPHLRLPTIPSAMTTRRAVSANTIFYASKKFIWIGNSKESVQGPILVYTPRQKDPIKIYPEGIFDPEQNSLHILQTGENIPLHDRITTLRPYVLSSLWSNLQHFTQRITPQQFFDLRAILFIGTFVCMLAALFSLLYLTRWLLFNALLVLAIPFLIQASIAFLDELGKIPALEYVPAILHGGIAILCFGFQLFLRPSSKR
ncbi:MAG: hypothetical protein N2442_03540 [Spirochaetes bacterium]|nr:hypothetical protein [Spirochaetota bacterium]